MQRLPTPGEDVGNYSILRELGRGGMGAVFLARDRLGRDAALKVSSCAEGPSPTQVERFNREALALARLEHPNIVRIYEAGWHGPLQYFAMELVDGRSLADRLRQEGRLRPTEGAALIETAARALHCAHEAGILHRDIKPANLLEDVNGRLLVCDFGLARIAEQAQRLTQTGELLGTPAFMSPEQADGAVHDLTPRTDVYGLGATLYTLLTGQKVYSGSVVQVLAALLSSKPAPPVSKLQPEVGAELDRICARALAKDPSKRFPSALALADALANCRRERSEGRRSPLALALAALVLLGVAAAFVLARGSPKPPPTAAPKPPPTAAPSSWSWSLLSRAPKAAREHGFAYDSERRMAMLFGGRPSATDSPQNTLWTWDGRNWAEDPSRADPKRPEARYAHAMVYDPARGELVVVGGVPANWKKRGLVFNDTWTWDGSNWRVHDAPAPLERYWHRMSYDSRRRRVLLFGGKQLSGEQPDDLWSWNGERWEELDVGPDRPARSLPALVYEASLNRLVVFGGFKDRKQFYRDTWVFQGQRWTRLEGPSPPARGMARLVDTEAGLLLIGGYVRRDGDKHHLNDLWLLEGERWTEVSSTLAEGAPPALAHYGAAWDPGAQRILVFGGQRLNELAAEDVLWAITRD